MATDFREQIKTVEEIRDATTFLYNPVVMAIKNKVKYDSQDADQHKFNTFDVEKDSIRAEILTTEQTEKAHIKGKTSSRVFNIYLAGAKAIMSFRNKHLNLDKANNKVVRGYLQLFDKWGLGGDRGNNGLLISNDPNYITNNAATIPAIAENSDDNWGQVNALSNTVTQLLRQVDKYTADNELLVYVYGDKLSDLMESVTKQNETVVQTLIEDKFKSRNVRLIHIPSLVMPASMANDNGFVVVSQNVTTLEYTQEPGVESNGTNEEDQYYWANYVLGSVQVAPDEEGAIIKQPLTFAEA